LARCSAWASKFLAGVSMAAFAMLTDMLLYLVPVGLDRAITKITKT
jgi:hypothetical protein